MRDVIRTLVVAGMIGVGAMAQAGEESIPLNKLPKGVLAAVKAKFPKGKPVEAAKEVEDGETKYEVVIMLEGKQIDVLVDDENEVEGYETEIEADDLTVRVAKALRKAYPKAKATKYEAVYEVENGTDELEYYEIHLVTDEKKEIEVKIQPSGTLVKGEEEEDKEEPRDAKGKEKGEKSGKKKKGDGKAEAKGEKKERKGDKKDNDDDEKEEKK